VLSHGHHELNIGFKKGGLETAPLFLVEILLADEEFVK
jgi:hypothetical protein